MNFDRVMLAKLNRFRQQHRIPALGVAIVSTSGLSRVEVVGVGTRDGSDSVTPEDPWHLGSCGKSITAAVYARLVELGDAEWGAPLPTLLPHLETSDSGWRDVRIDEMLVHRSGMAANLKSSEMHSAFSDTRPLPEQRLEAAASALSRPPLGQGRFRYSNLGYVVAGAAIEHLTGKPYEQAAVELILEPLGIRSSGFGPPAFPSGHGGRLPYVERLGLVVGRGTPADPNNPHSDNPPVLTPAGRFHMTLEDWSKFQQLFLTAGGGLLRPESIQRLLTPSEGGGPHQAMGWAPANIPGISIGQQGSNTYWVATALINQSRDQTALVVTNDGRTRMLSKTATLAATLLSTQ